MAMGRVSSCGTLNRLAEHIISAPYNLFSLNGCLRYPPDSSLESMCCYLAFLDSIVAIMSADGVLDWRLDLLTTLTHDS
jgi:hypothetical protein